MKQPARFTLTNVLAAALLALAFVDVAAFPEGATAALPNSIASTGDSIIRAFNTGKVPFLDAPQNSWSTGTTTSVNSVYLRILAPNSQIKDHNYNDGRAR